MKKSSGRLSTIFLVLIFLAGLSLLLYPTLSDYYNSFHTSKVIVNYAQEVANMDNEAYEALFQEANRYNKDLAASSNPWLYAIEHKEEYQRQLAVPGNHILGYIDIPLIDVYLPIYHGTEESVLQIGVGHIEGTSLPIGGEGTHSSLSGHRGLPSARLFTSLDKMTEGDTFLLHILDETLTYQVDQILIVEPNDSAPLAIEPGKDYCTLITCTPYGINSHRLLVRGHRIETEKTATQIRVSADGVLLEPVLVAPVVAAPILLILLLLLLVTTRRRKR